MKILYAIQGTGNGHVSRAREIIPHLKLYGDVDLLLSGNQAEVGLDDPVKFRFTGMGFAFGTNGGIDFKKSLRDFNTKAFLRDCRSLPVQDYDLILNDFEPVSAWACRFRGIKSVAMSHQAAYLSSKTPQLQGLHYGRAVLKNYAPATHHIAFHFDRYDDFIHTPVIRREIRDIEPTNLGHYTVYLPAYSDEFILQQISGFRGTRWEIFSKHSKISYEKGNVKIVPINNALFLKSLSSCTGLLTGGGFEGPAEALFLGKKLLSVPMKNQYEQQCNALALEKMGVPVIWNESQFQHKLQAFVNEDRPVSVFYADETAEIIRGIMQNYTDK